MPGRICGRNWQTFEDPYEGAQRGRPPARKYLSSVGTHRLERTNLRFGNVRVIDIGQSKCGQLLRDAWHTGPNSCNRCIELHPAYRVLRYRLSNRGRPNWSQSGTRTRREEKTTVGDDQTPQDQRIYIYIYLVYMYTRWSF